MAYDLAFQTKVWPLLQAAVTTALSSIAGGRIFWKQTAEETYPQVIFQSQAAGSRRDYLGANGWAGPVTFRALALDPDEADALLASIPTLVHSLSDGGYTIGITFDRPALSLWEESPQGRLYTSAATATVTIN